MTRQVVVVGAGLAGATTATTLRQLGFDGDVVLVGDEPHLPYERPALSKTYLTGETSREQLLVRTAAEYDELGITLRLGTRVVALENERRAVSLDDGSALPFDALVVATGSRNRVPPLAGIDLAGVHQLRTLDDADRLAEHARRARRGVLVGMGFVGCEVAATLRTMGLDVTMVDRAPGPLWAQLGPRLSGVVRSWHAEHGVALVPDVDVAAFEGAERVDAVRLVDDTVLPADLVVVGVGVQPATDWLQSAPLHLEQSAVGVDAAGRSSVPGVYAVGDVAAAWDARAGVHRRVEHYRGALTDGRAVAHAVLGLPLPAPESTWFWSEQYDHVLHYAGHRSADDEVHAQEGSGALLFTGSGVTTAVAAVDDPRGFRRALRLLGSSIDDGALAASG